MRCETFDRRGDINPGRAAWRRSTGAVCFVDRRYTLLRHHLWPVCFAPRHHWFRYLVVMALICGRLTQQCVRGLGGDIAMTPYRSCVPPSTIWSAGTAQLLGWGVHATAGLVETLLDGGGRR
jgi:hypothetical protein